MKRFTFRLETLLELRTRMEDGIKQELADKLRELLRARNDLAGLSDALKKLQEEEKKRRSDAQSALELRYGIVYRFKLKKDILLKGRQIEDLHLQAHAIRTRLVKAKRDRRAIEIIRERQRAAWKKACRTQEQGFIDDVSQQGYLRRTRAPATAAL